MMNILIYTYIVVANATPMVVNMTESSQPNIVLQKDLALDGGQMVPIQNHKRSNDPTLTFDASNLIEQIEQNTTKLWNKTNDLFYGMPDPWKLDAIKPKLMFYKAGHLTPFEIDYNASLKDSIAELKETGMLDTNRLVFITHGFHNDITTDWLTSYKDKILNVSRLTGNEQTVALLGWGDGANILVFRYRQASANVFPVGYWLGNVTKILKSAKPDLPIYGIGHSLGAHVMGVAGRCSKLFDRITGLDPAGPCFEKVENSGSLNKSDAKFVDIIHTDGYDSKLDPSEWFFPVNHYGMLIPIGTVDFYPNYGYHQPNAGTFKVAGSHLRALELFEWSIENPNKFIASEVLDGMPDYDIPVTKTKPASTKLEMGFHADHDQLPVNQTSLYYIKTNGEIPWV